MIKGINWQSYINTFTVKNSNTKVLLLIRNEKISATKRTSINYLARCI